MSQRDQYIKYLSEAGISPRFKEIFEKLCAEDPWPEDPLYYMLQQLGCPLIPTEQMEELEQKVNAANAEIRNLQRILCNMGYEHECRYVLDMDLESSVYRPGYFNLGTISKTNMRSTGHADSYFNQMHKGAVPNLMTTNKTMNVPSSWNVLQSFGKYKEDDFHCFNRTPFGRW